VLIAVPGAAALAQDTGTSPAPTIQSDKDDYAPGELVTLTGGGWQAGESVHINVNDDVGKTWSYDKDVTADASGNITDQFNLPDWFVATYNVTATGASGTATTSFTDGNVVVRAAAGSTALAVTFPTNSVQRFDNTTCTAPVAKFNGTAFTTPSSGTGGTNSGVTADNSQSVKLQAPSPVTIGGTTYTFSSWSGTAASANLNISSTGCITRTATTPPDPTWNITANYVVSDTTAPTVTVVSASPATIGASGSSTITWNANENGSFSVRVGGTSCSTGTEVASGNYSTQPNNTTSTVNASDLSEGANTIRVCVTDSANNTGSATTTVTKDTIAPVVTLTQVNGSARTFPYFTNQNVASVGGSCTNGDGDVSVTLDGNATNPATATCSSGSWTLNLMPELSAEGTYVFAASQTDAAGNIGTSDNKSVTIDKTPPTVTPTAFKGPDFTDTYPADTWTNKDVRVTFTCADNTGGSGLTSASGNEEDNFTTETSGATATFDGTCADKAGNNATSDLDFGPIKIDKSAPTNIQFSGTTLTDGTTYDFGDVPAGPTGCTANGDISGLKSCGTDAATTYKTTVGTHTITATAEDNAGNTSQATLSYTVRSWTMTGFYQPVDMNGVYNTVKSGSTVPLKFEVFKGPSSNLTELTDTLSTIGGNSDVKVTSINCEAGASIDDVETTVSGNTVLRYDTTSGQFVFNWQTPKNKAGSCYKVTIPAKDGVSSLTAYFKLK
jgi:hypothetical protein